MMEIHPYYKKSEPTLTGVIGGFLPANAETLIIGTFPPTKRTQQEIDEYFFYSSPLNQFWNRIDNIFINDKSYSPLKQTKHRNADLSKLENNERIKTFCINKKLGFLDFFCKIERKKLNSVADEDLINNENIIENNYLFNYLDNNSTIKRICCVYKRAYEDLLKDLKNTQFNLLGPIAEKGTAHNEKYILNYKDKMIDILLLFPATRSPHKGELKDIQYGKYLFGISN